MYLELKFRMAKECWGKGWELYYVNEMKEKYVISDSNNIKRVYLDDARSMIIPDEIDGLPVISIAVGVKLSPITEVLVLPKLLTNIQMDAFCKSHIVSLHIGKSLKSLDFLSGLKWLEQVSISPENETFRVYDGSVYLLDLNELTWAKDENIRPGTAVIGRKAFTNLIMLNLYIPESVRCIKSEAFINCDIDELSVSSEVEKIQEDTFCDCRIEKLEFRDETSKGLYFTRHSVLNCVIKKIVLPERTKSVPDYAFEVIHLCEIELAGCGYARSSFNGYFNHLSRIALKFKKGESFPAFNYPDSPGFIGQQATPIILVKENNLWTEEVYW